MVNSMHVTATTLAARLDKHTQACGMQFSLAAGGTVSKKEAVLG